MSEQTRDFHVPDIFLTSLVAFLKDIQGEIRGGLGELEGQSSYKTCTNPVKVFSVGCANYLEHADLVDEAAMVDSACMIRGRLHQKVPLDLPTKNATEILKNPRDCSVGLFTHV